MKSRSSVVSHLSVVSHPSSYQSEGAGSSTDILDLTLPDKNAAFEVCYVCGDEFKRGALSYSFAKQYHKEPFYPSLVNHPRPARSRPMDSAGRVQTCDDCHNHLLTQWYTFEADGLAHNDRHYAIRKRQVPNIDITMFICYECALEYHSSNLRLIYVKSNPDNEPYYPKLAQQKPPAGASAITSSGLVQVCSMCYKVAKESKDKVQQFSSGSSSQMQDDRGPGWRAPPPKKRRMPPNIMLGDSFETAHRPNVPGLNDEEEDSTKNLPADMTCPCCRRKYSYGTFKSHHTIPPPYGGNPYFPFLAELPQPDDLPELDQAESLQNKKVKVCTSCSASFVSQWQTQAREGVEADVRQYTYPSLISGTRSVVSSVRAQSPASQRSSGAVTPIKIPGESSNRANNRTRSNTLESHQNRSAPQSPLSHPPPVIPSTLASSSAGPKVPTAVILPTIHSPTPPASSASVPGGSRSAVITIDDSSSTSKTKDGANCSSFYCFLCGLHSELSFSRMLYSSAPGKRAPYFPFMKNHVPKQRAETLREDGTALVCTFCYHSVMIQWNRYNEGRPYIDPTLRKYNFHDYNCYVCGVQTYRKRIRALRVLVSDEKFRE